MEISFTEPPLCDRVLLLLRINHQVWDISRKQLFQMPADPFKAVFIAIVMKNWGLVAAARPCFPHSPELYRSAYHIILPNRNQTINETEFKVHSLLHAFERVRSKQMDVTCSGFFPAVSRAAGVNVMPKGYIKAWSYFPSPLFLDVFLRIPKFSIYLEEN